VTSIDGKVPPNAEAEVLFESMDRNSNGVVDREEWRGGGETVESLMADFTEQAEQPHVCYNAPS